MGIASKTLTRMMRERSCKIRRSGCLILSKKTTVEPLTEDRGDQYGFLTHRYLLQPRRRVVIRPPVLAEALYISTRRSSGIRAALGHTPIGLLRRGMALDHGFQHIQERILADEPPGRRVVLSRSIVIELGIRIPFPPGILIPRRYLPQRPPERIVIHRPDDAAGAGYKCPGATQMVRQEKNRVRASLLVPQLVIYPRTIPVVHKTSITVLVQHYVLAVIGVSRPFRSLDSRHPSSKGIILVCDGGHRRSTCRIYPGLQVPVHIVSIRHTPRRRHRPIPIGPDFVLKYSQPRRNHHCRRRYPNFWRIIII